MGIVQLSRHLKSKHNVIYKDYIAENLEEFKQFGWNRCPYTGKILKGTVSPEFKNQYLSDVTKGISKGPMSDETKRKLSEGRKGEKHWNYGKKRDFMTDEIRKKIGDKAKERLRDPTKHPFYGKIHSNETKNKMSNVRIERGLGKGKLNGMYGKTHTPEAIEKIFKHKKMNKLENRVAKRLTKLGFDYTFQFFINKDGVCKSYDFKIKDKPYIIEVDGDFWHGNPNTTNHHTGVEQTKKNDILKEEIAKWRGYIVIRLWESDINNDITIVDKTLKESYLY